MSVNRRIRFAVAGSALTFALSTFGVSPVQADDQQPPGIEVDMPADLEITEATEVPKGSEPSSGSSTHPCIGYTTTYASSGCFQPYGDVFYVTDLLADGRSAAVGVFTDYGRAKQACVFSLGAGKTGKCDWDYWEKGNVKLEILLYDRATKGWYQPEAWSDWLPVDGQ
ncbi:hypothetical protein ACWD7Y_22670 [Streptomyces drozdowiczii]